MLHGRHEKLTDRQTDGRTNRQMDRQTGWIQYTPLTSLGGGYKKWSFCLSLNVLTHWGLVMQPRLQEVTHTGLNNGLLSLLHQCNYLPQCWLHHSLHIISMAQSKTPVTPFLMHWSYCSLALSHRHNHIQQNFSCNSDVSIQENVCEVTCNYYNHQPLGTYLLNSASVKTNPLILSYTDHNSTQMVMFHFLGVIDSCHLIGSPSW